MASATPTFTYAAGPVHVHVASFGEDVGGAYAGLVTFGGTGPDPLPSHVREALLGHIRRGERVLVLTRDPAQKRWVQAQVALLTAPGGRA